MSTPTTAVATLPHYHPHHYPHTQTHPHPNPHTQPQPQPQLHPHSQSSYPHSHHQSLHRPGLSANYRLPPPHTTGHHASSTTTTAAASATASNNVVANNAAIVAGGPNLNVSGVTAPSASSSHASRNPPLYQPASSAGYAPSTDGVAQRTSAPRPPPHAYHLNVENNRETDRPTRSHLSQQDLQHQHHQQPQSHQHHHQYPQDDTYPADMAAEQPAKKRRRSHGPDWQDFYRNGLPNEIIVIDDDSPEPEANTSRRITTNGHSQSQSHSTNSAAAAAGPASTINNHNYNANAATSNGNVNGSSSSNGHAPNGSATRPPTKKRRRDDDLSNGTTTTQGNGYHVQYLGSQTNTPAGSTMSSDRTNSALNTTAPTSLSSNSQHDESTLPLKRKRTRQQVANEAKRRDTDVLGNRCLTYKPPPLPPKKAAEVNVRSVVDPPHFKNVKVDDDDGHYIVVPDAPLTERYQITRLLGQGTFGKVVEAHDRRRSKAVAVKIIRSVQKYRDASRIELRVLATLKANDDENRNRCIHLRDCFDYRGHICIVMDLLGQSVFDFLKGNGFTPFPNSQIQSFARQLFTSVAFLHDLNLIHTDLKPENILLCDRNYQTFTYNRRIPSSSTTINRSATQRRVLLDTEIRLIDFGSATFEDEYHSSVVSTRHYRAPEIILGLGWSFPCDIWSIGCILVEFFTGDALFQTHDNLEHLAMMEAVVGKRIDSHLVQSVNKMTGRNANSASKYFKRLKLDYPNTETTRGSRRFVKAMKHLDDVIPQSNNFMKNFRDLLKKIFVYDPNQRITAKEALKHDWFKEMAYNDDGTEAAKIRLEKMMRAGQGVQYT